MLSCVSYSVSLVSVPPALAFFLFCSWKNKSVIIDKMKWNFCLLYQLISSAENGYTKNTIFPQNILLPEWSWCMKSPSFGNKHHELHCRIIPCDMVTSLAISSSLGWYRSVVGGSKCIHSRGIVRTYLSAVDSLESLFDIRKYMPII